jgi:hypothetical protein
MTIYALLLICILNDPDGQTSLNVDTELYKSKVTCLKDANKFEQSNKDICIQIKTECKEKTLHYE